MNDTTRHYINDLAESVLKYYDIPIPIANIEDVVTQMGGTIETLPGLNLYDGTIRKTGEKSFQIAVSPYQSRERRAFTIAHELGHLFLHMGFQTDASVWNQQDNENYTRFGNSEQEYQANEFAAALLMPAEQYRQVLNQYAVSGRVDVGKIAGYFHVSIAAATNRGRFLGYLVWH